MFKSYIYVVVNSLVMLFIGVIVYKLLWENASNIDFNRWVGVFELGVLFLLLDLGFTHKFMKIYINGKIDSNFLKDYQKLSFTLLCMGILGFVGTFILAVSAHNPLIPSLGLSLSILINLMSYPDTVVLKIKEDFEIISKANIISNILYLLFVLLFKNYNIIYIIGFGIFLRSITCFLMLRYNCLSLYNIHFNLQRKLQNIDFSIIWFNLSYFSLFIFDVYLLNILGFASVIIAQLIVYKKYYETLRGFFENILNVIMVKVAKEADNSSILFYIIVSLGFFISFLLSYFILPLWFKEFAVDKMFNCIMMIYSLLILIYRVHFTSFYFNRNINFFRIFLIIIALKGIFIVLTITHSISLKIFFLLQALMIMLFVSKNRFILKLISN